MKIAKICATCSAVFYVIPSQVASYRRCPTCASDPLSRFWSKVAKSDGCWEWQGSRHRKGYGQFRFEGHNQLAHRVAYKLTYGPVSNDTDVLHDCDNPSCVRPDHLYLGTHQDNMHDMSARKRCGVQRHPERYPRGDDHYWHQNPERVRRGEEAAKAKLTREQVQEIRQAHNRGSAIRALARQYNVSQASIQRIVRGINWAWLPEIVEQEVP